MKYVLDIFYDGLHRLYYVLKSSDFDRIEIPGVLIIDLYKWHNHRYSFKAFFYGVKVIVSSEFYSTKKELFGAVQSRLQQFLYNV